jgi:hypothetical protein
MSVDNIAQPAMPDVPSTRTTQAALALMSTLGAGDKKAWAYLTEMQKAGEHNDRVLADIQNGRVEIANLKQREADVAKREADVDAKLAKAARIVAAINYPKG